MAITEDALKEARKRAELMQQGSGASGPISEQFIRSLAGDVGAAQQLQQEITARTKPKTDRTQRAPRQDDLISLQRRQGEAELEAARKRKLLGVTEAKEAVGTQAQKERVATGVQRQKDAGSFGKLFLARGGLSQSGAAGQGEIARGVAQQQSLTDIGLGEQAQLGQLGLQEQAAQQEFETGRQQLGFQTREAQINQQLAQQQAEQQSQQQLQHQQFEISEADRIRALEFQNTQTLRQIDSELQQARDTQNFAREQQLLNQRAQIENNQIRLREAVKPVKKATEKEGITSDTLKSFKSGADRLIARIDPSGNMTQEQVDAQEESIIEQQVSLMVQRGATRDQIEDFIASYGIQTTTGTPIQTGMQTGQAR